MRLTRLTVIYETVNTPTHINTLTLSALLVFSKVQFHCFICFLSSCHLFYSKSSITCFPAQLTPLQAEEWSYFKKSKCHEASYFLNLSSLSTLCGRQHKLVFIPIHVLMNSPLRLYEGARVVVATESAKQLRFSFPQQLPPAPSAGSLWYLHPVLARPPSPSGP